ncbi:uncharacterized protein JN550_000461 [Neoarthrinium moseri]|uniref:uncharacterized protein n=1 Tax=Neoarthrinium moseri TaxID=1658444 RepID=UPI001FDDF949|nr:uncharacterized protein JN550_000461 [Neoarthrinium moseri]KAI1878279.1 hypothetical protein JN550_000461 [Neoarthrinium moseri]
MDYKNTRLTLYSYFRSSCSARVRTAACLKGIKLHYEYVNLLKGEQSADVYTRLNPAGTVPTLVVESPDGSNFLIRQSVAILEFFEDAFPGNTPLLPSAGQPLLRAKVRDLVNIMACEFQPKTNLCVLKRVAGFGVSSPDWCKEQMVPALLTFESGMQEHAGKYCVGDSITLADVVLAPAVEGALRWGIDLQQFPQIQRVYDNIRVVPSFVDADWKHQADTPETLRA